jgi:hypothetical protein
MGSRRLIVQLVISSWMKKVNMDDGECSPGNVTSAPVFLELLDRYPGTINTCPDVAMRDKNWKDIVNGIGRVRTYNSWKEWRNNACKMKVNL